MRKAGYSPKSKYSDEEIIRLFSKKAKELGRCPKRIEIDKDPELPSASVYYKRFGSIGNLQNKLGIRPNIFKCSDEKLIQMLKRKAKELGRPPMGKDITEDKALPCLGVYYNHFGTLQRARELAGCPSPKTFRTYTNDELIEMLRRKIESLGRMPITKEIDDDERMPHSTTYSHRFGGYQNLLKIMGFPPTKKYKENKSYLKPSGEYDTQKILKYIRKKSKKMGRFPTLEEIREDPNIPCFETLRKLFGSMQELALLIGILLRQGNTLHIQMRSSLNFSK